MSAADKTRSYGRGAGVAGIGIGLTGLVTQAYFSLSSYELSAADYGALSLLWTSIFLVCSILYRPVEQLLGRTIADREARGVGGHEHLRVAATIQLALAAVFVALALALRGPLEEDLFGGEETLYWILVAAVLAYAASYFARGYLAGHRRLGLYGALVFLESVVRVMFALLAVLGVATSQGFVALGMAVAPAVSLVVVPWALRRHLRPAARGDFGLRQGTRFAGAVLVIMVCEQAFLNAGPLLVRADTGSIAIAGFAFNVVLILRAPLQLFQAIQTAILPHLTSLSATDAADDFRTAVNTTVRAIAAFAGLVTLALLAVGPWAMHLLFGDKGFDYDRLGLVAMGAGMGFYLVGATLNQAALALGHAARAAACWVASATTFVIVLVLPLMDDEVVQLTVAFLAGALVLCATLHWLYRRALAQA